MGLWDGAKGQFRERMMPENNYVGELSGLATHIVCKACQEKITNSRVAAEKGVPVPAKNRSLRA